MVKPTCRLRACLSQGTRSPPSKIWAPQRCRPYLPWTGRVHEQTVRSLHAWLHQNTDAALILPQNQFDSIDLSDNAIVRLDGFPKLPRLSWLLLCNNRIARVAPNLEGKPHQLLLSFVEVRQHNASRQAPNGL